MTTSINQLRMNMLDMQTFQANKTKPVIEDLTKEEGILGFDKKIVKNSSNLRPIS